jgi:hypothetical protein
LERGGGDQRRPQEATRFGPGGACDGPQRGHTTRGSRYNMARNSRIETTIRSL